MSSIPCDPEGPIFIAAEDTDMNWKRRKLITSDRCKYEHNTYIRENKINQANSLPPVGIEPGNLGLWGLL